ncbi:MAG: cytochrome c3 family protein [Gemmatimonadetes bacterium]|nr:cytochrome c3 family protein [Gemmatimonadota bacterium]MCK5484369.1 cytochrome c3 family protein [Gemmatimonadota bacterium]MCK5489498.1 cytochrome c3 family protein [Gemmatimonadota bacterium]
MKRRIGVIGLLLTVTLASPDPMAAQDGADSCIACHEMLSGRLGEPVQAFAEDVHMEAGFGCAACHGGDPTIQGPAAMDEAKGYIGRPSPGQVPDVCGRCHSNASFMRQYDPSLRVDQVAEYVTSVHGQRLLGAADTAVATCASCHQAHSIRPASDPRSSVHPLNVADTCESCHSDPARMEPYGIPTDQGAEYRRSIHWETMSEGGDTSAPTCNDCHGNHGAAPPGISWVGNVCGQCHVVMADYFGESRHAETFTMLGVPGCAACHQNHDVQPAHDEMLGVGEAAVCSQCHRESDAGGTAAEEMRTLIDGLRLALDTARTVLLDAEDSGMEVSEALVSLNDGQSALVKSRAAIHAFDVEAVREEVEPGSEISEEALARGHAALRDLQVRRMGLAVSVIIIGALIVGLVLKIREVERPA